MDFQNTEYQIGNAVFTVDRIFDDKANHFQLITDAIVAAYRKNRDFDNPAATCYNQNVSERFF